MRHSWSRLLMGLFIGLLQAQLAEEAPLRCVMYLTG